MEKILHFVKTAENRNRLAAAIEEASALHPNWTVQVWDSTVELVDARLGSLPVQPIPPSAKKDFISLLAVYDLGGIYLSDELRLRDPLDQLARKSHFFWSPDGTRVSSAVFGAAQFNPHFRELVNELADTGALESWSSLSEHLTRSLRWRSGIVLVPRNTFDCESGAEARKPGASSDRKSLKQRFRGSRQTTMGTSSRSQPAHYFSGDSLVVATHEDVVLCLPPEDLSTVPTIALFGTHEPHELSFIRSVLEGGDFMVDVGCNVGLHTLVAAKAVGPFGRVFAFDPNSQLLDFLRNSLRMNWLHDRVKIKNSAIGAAPGISEFSFPSRSYGEGSLSTEVASAHGLLRESIGSSDVQKVPVERLDDLFDTGLEIKVLKVDVEGHDYAVLRGAEQLFSSRTVSHLLVEAYEAIAPKRFQLLVEELVRIEDFGYAVQSLGKDGSLSAPFRAQELRHGPGSRGTNLVVSRKEANQA